jgi:integrase
MAQEQAWNRWLGDPGHPPAQPHLSDSSLLHPSRMLRRAIAMGKLADSMSCSQVIQRILRHANVSTTATYYIKTAAADVRSAMTKLENHIANGAQHTADAIDTGIDSASSEPSSIQ